MQQYEAEDSSTTHWKTSKDLMAINIARRLLQLFDPNSQSNLILRFIFKCTPYFGAFTHLIAALSQISFMMTNFSANDLNVTYFIFKELLLKEKKKNSIYFFQMNLQLYWFASYALVQFFILLSTILKQELLILFGHFVNKTFWNVKHRPDEFNRLQEFNYKSMTFVTLFASTTIICSGILLVMPFLDSSTNHGNNRSHPFPMFVDRPFQRESPWFELIYAVQVMLINTFTLTIQLYDSAKSENVCNQLQIMGVTGLWVTDVLMNFYNFTINLYVSYQFKLLNDELKRSFENAFVNVDRLLANSSNHEKLDKLMRQLISKNKVLYFYVEVHNNIASQIVFVCSLNCVFR